MAGEKGFDEWSEMGIIDELEKTSQLGFCAGLKQVPRRYEWMMKCRGQRGTGRRTFLNAYPDPTMASVVPIMIGTGWSGMGEVTDQGLLR